MRFNLAKRFMTALALIVLSDTAHAASITPTQCVDIRSTMKHQAEATYHLQKAMYETHKKLLMIMAKELLSENPDIIRNVASEISDALENEADLDMSIISRGVDAINEVCPRG